MTMLFAPSSSPHQFLPAIPSPLSPRSANIYGRHTPRDSSMSEPQKLVDTSHMSNTTTASSSKLPFSKRPVKKAPSATQDELKERRRNNFLRKVRDNRDDKRFEARSEDVMRMDFMQRKRAYENELARSAPLLLSDPIEEEEEDYQLPVWSQQGSQMQMSSQRTVQDEADEFEREEEDELMALLEYMPGKETEESLWSDDADYDALFSEVMEQENTMPQCEQQQDGEEMDMS